MTQYYDVVIVGSGNAGFSAAHAAREQTESVLLLEKASSAWVGGNSYFTAGAFRTTFNSLEELLPILDEVDQEALKRTKLPPYTVEHFRQDMQRITKGRSDPELTGILTEKAADTIRWLHSRGLRFRLMYDRQSFDVDGEFHFWGGLALGSVDGGKGLIEQHLNAATATNIEIRYESPVIDFLRDENGALKGVICKTNDGISHIEAGAVVLAAGGFEANARLRTSYLGPGWDLAKVRGTPYNTGEVLHAAIDIGAQAYGHWSGCHSVAWDAAASAWGNRDLTNLLTKQSYPLGIVINADARRFIDEGEDFRNYTYAKYGAEIMKQRDAIAFQLFDAKTRPLLRQDEYTAPGVSGYEATTLHELATKIGVVPEVLQETVNAFNDSIKDVPFNPAIKDGKCTRGITPRKSNWAQPLDTPPYYAFAVTCGITFTFGGLRIDTTGQVLDWSGTPMPGLYAAGELVGGLFYYNYPGGSGLTAGSVFGRLAGQSAANWAKARRSTRMNV
jgi:tricarballylate dehydrogenase